jgi:hypothetical protein
VTRADLAIVLITDPRLRLASKSDAIVERMVARATGMPRPAKPARQARYVRSSPEVAVPVSPW